MRARVHVIVSGRVTGVNFRYNIKSLADRLSIFGWIKNLSDTEVEAVFEGEKESIEKMIEFCKRGPAMARVEDVKIEIEDFKDEFRNFRIVH